MYFLFKSAFYIPPTEVNTSSKNTKKLEEEVEDGIEVIKPFHVILKYLQGKRVEYPKGGFNNL